MTKTLYVISGRYYGNIGPSFLDNGFLDKANAENAMRELQQAQWDKEIIQYGDTMDDLVYSLIEIAIEDWEEFINKNGD